MALALPTLCAAVLTYTMNATSISTVARARIRGRSRSGVAVELPSRRTLAASVVPLSRSQFLPPLPRRPQFVKRNMDLVWASGF